MHGVAVQRVLFQLGRELFHQIYGLVVCAVVIVAIFREIALNGKIHCNALFVAHRAHLGPADGRKRICRHRKPGHAKGHNALYICVVQRHLPGLVGIFVVHVMDDVHGVGIQPGRILQHLLVVGAHLVVLQHFIRDGFDARHNDAALDFIHTAVDGVQQGLCQIAARAEKLHLLAHTHGRDAAGNGIVVAIDGAHDIIVLVLDGICCNRHFGAVALEFVGQMLAPQHGEVRLRRSAQVCQRVQNAERRLGHKRFAVQADAANRLCHPCGVAAEQLVVIRRAQMAHQAQFDDELVN